MTKDYVPDHKKSVPALAAKMKAKKKQKKLQLKVWALNRKPFINRMKHAQEACDRKLSYELSKGIAHTEERYKGRMEAY